MPLIQVIKFYKQKEEELHQDEFNDDFRCKNGAPVRISNYGGLLGHAADVYTLTIFKMFEEEFLEGIGMDGVQVPGDDTYFTYKVSKYANKREFIGQFDNVTYGV